MLLRAHLSMPAQGIRNTNDGGGEQNGADRAPASESGREVKACCFKA
jgi:hypothetical protein